MPGFAHKCFWLSPQVVNSEELPAQGKWSISDKLHSLLNTKTLIMSIPAAVTREGCWTPPWPFKHSRRTHPPLLGVHNKLHRQYLILGTLYLLPDSQFLDFKSWIFYTCFPGSLKIYLDCIAWLMWSVPGVPSFPTFPNLLMTVAPAEHLRPSPLLAWGPQSTFKGAELWCYWRHSRCQVWAWWAYFMFMLEIITRR